MVYVISIVLATFLSFFEKIKLNLKIKKNFVNFIIIAITLFFVVICACRSIYIGRDTRMYYLFYEQAAELSWTNLKNSWQQNDLEIGYLAIEFLFSNILGLSFIYFQIFVATISIVPPMYLIYKYSDSKGLSIILYLLLGMYCFTLTGIRQSISLGLMCIAYFFVEKNKLIPFLFFCIIGFLFHFSSLILLPIYFFKKIKITNIFLFVCVIIIAFFFIFGNPIYEIINLYLGLPYETESSSGGFGFYFFVLINVVVAYIYTKKSLKREEEYKFQFLLVVFYLVLWPLVRFNTSAFRITYIYQIMLCIFIPNYLKRIKFVDIRFIVTGVVIAISLIYSNFYVFNEFNRYYPYYFYWQK